MTTTRRSDAAEARWELGLWLRQLRKAAGLTGQALAEATGQHVTRISRIENGIQPPTERNIRDWCAACGAEDQIPDLIATARTTESAYLDWVRQSRAGMRRLGDAHSIATYRRTTTFRIHEPLVMPGIFQTEAYTRRMLAFWYPFLGAPDDTDATVAMKAERTAVALETPTAAIKITRPREVAQYAAMFGHLRDEAIHGHQARQLITAILASRLAQRPARHARTATRIRKQSPRHHRAHRLAAGEPPARGASPATRHADPVPGAITPARRQRRRPHRPSARPRQPARTAGRARSC